MPEKPYKHWARLQLTHTFPSKIFSVLSTSQPGIPCVLSGINGFHIGQDQLQDQPHLFQSVDHHKESSALSLCLQVGKKMLTYFAEVGLVESWQSWELSDMSTLGKVDSSQLLVSKCKFFYWTWVICDFIRTYKKEKIDCLNLSFHAR